jgi:taurine dioxygenase
MALEVIPSGKALGAEIRGTDLSEGLNGETLSAVNAAWLEHLVLLFRNQTIDDHQLLQMAENLGGAKQPNLETTT